MSSKESEKSVEQLSEIVDDVANEVGEKSPLNQGRGFSLNLSTELIVTFFGIILTALLGIIFTIQLQQFSEINKDIDSLEKWKEDVVSIQVPKIDNKLLNLSYQIDAIDKKNQYISKQLLNIGTKLFSLNEQRFTGKAVFYRDDDIPSSDKGKRICALNYNFSWHCDISVIKRYTGHKIYLTVAGHSDIAQLFEVRGVFNPKDRNGDVDESRMIEIPKESLKDLVPSNEVEELIKKGLITVTIKFQD